ncbi:MAG: hypothetical protein EBU90_05755 [Proteobacteria bacterium]|nr:hypothetical protein [Pseudomonadota bacterium]NBP13931.1 hypothetical protein [bacterium]
MNRSLSLLFLLCGAGAMRANDVSGISYFNVRPVQSHPMQQNLLVDQATDTGRVLRMKGVQATVFFGQSTAAEELGKYFGIGGKSELTVKEDNPANDAAEFTQDILALNFNLDTNADGFHSTIKFRPQQTFGGVGLSARMHFRDCYWLMVEAPIVYVKNNMHLTETIINNGGGAAAGTGIGGFADVSTMKDAFKQAGMLYGKIDGAQSKTGLADLTIKFGYDNPFLNRKDLFMNMFVGVVLPTGNKPKAVYMFEPIYGNGGHAAFMMGSHGEVDLGKFKQGKLWLSWNAHTQYLFQNTQKRSFDLKHNGQWSRYLSMFENLAKNTDGDISTTTFGINLLTQDAKVTPGYSGTFDTSIAYIGAKYYGGAGYSTFVRQAEKVELAKAWQYTEAAITDYGANGEATNRFRTIGTLFTDLNQTLANRIAISEIDIDLNSAAHPSSVSHMVHANLGYHDKTRSYPFIVEAGASYEFSRQNTALNRWALSASTRVSF